MEKKLSNSLLTPPSIVKSSTLYLPSSQTLRSTGSSTGNPRNKCALKPGHSLMDWIRLGNSGVDLSGTKGRIVPITKDELAKHNKRDDAWMAIQGVVYNVTKYMDFHPGGVEELMRGVGTDATKLFNETHAWVNYVQLLNKCRIGPLTNTIKLETEIKESLTLPVNKAINSSTKPLIQPQDADIIPRLDWIQKRDEITLYFYTKLYCNPGSIIRNVNSDNCIEIWILLSHYVHKFDFELQGRIKWPPKRLEISSESGRIEVKFSKHNDQPELWSDLGKYKKTKSLANTHDLEIDLEYKILAKKQFNNDSVTILIKNEKILYKLPIGYHLTIEGIINNTKSTKPYTPVPKKYIEKYISLDDKDMECKYFIIKQYSYPNSFSQHLCNLEKDTTLKISLPKGNFKLASLAFHRRFCFLAAGSGLTPFLGLIDHLLKRNTNRIEVLKLLYFNKTTADIWCHEILTNVSLEDKRFEFINILSNAEQSWSGIKGRVSSELLIPIINKTVDNITYIAVCGPNSFNTNVEKILKDLMFPNENLFIF